MIMVTISGPSIRGDEVITIKQSAAQNIVSRTHCVLVSGFRMAYIFDLSVDKKRVDKNSVTLEKLVNPSTKTFYNVINIPFSSFLLWHRYMLLQ